jgi:radical SAM protein with 4Fe4S-binding SPASM domain
MRGNRLNFFYLDKLLSSFAFPSRNWRECGAGSGVMAVSPDGDIFPCHKFVGYPDFRLGNVTQGTWDPSKSYLLWNTNVGTKSKCQSCWARFICGGGCHADAVFIEGDLCTPYEIYCELMRHRIEVGAWLYTELRETDYALFEDAIPDLRACHASKPRTAARVELRRDGDPYLVDSDNGSRIALNAVSAMIWNACDGKSSLYDIAGHLHRTYDIDVRTALDDVRYTVLRFDRCGFIE